MRYLQHVVVLLAAAVMMLCGCDNDPVQPGDAIPDAPTGMPDWSDSSYDWIALTCPERCPGFCGRGIWWYPKFSLQIFDISPDGNTLLMTTWRGLVLYDIPSGMTDVISPELFEDVVWSRNGRAIAGIRYKAPSIRERIALYDLQSRSWSTVQLPDSTEFINPRLQWMSGDTALLIATHRGSITGYDVVNITPPFTIRQIAVHNLSATFLNEQAHNLVGSDYLGREGIYQRMELRIGPIGDTINTTAYHLAGIGKVTGPTHISRDGKWLGLPVDVDLRNTRLATSNAERDIITALCIIDLRPGSPTQHQVYRVFPDHTGRYRRCAFWFELGLALSPDGRYAYHEQVRIADSTMQIVRRDIRTGRTEEISNFLSPP